MKLTLKNIGILKTTEIDLSKDFIILTGPNNTGKTYAAYIVYALYRYAYRNDLGFIDLIDKVNIKVEELLAKGTIEINVWELFIKNENSFTTRYVNLIKRNLSSVFDTSEELFKTSQLELSFDREKLEALFLISEYEKVVRYGAISTNIIKKAGSLNLEITTVYDEGIGNDTEKQNRLRILINAILPNYLTSLLLQTIFQKSYIAPAERSAINLFSRQLSVQRNKLVDDLLAYSDSKGILAKAQLYPLPIRDSLEIAERLTEFQKQKSEYFFLADEIEDEILRGKIKVSKDGEVQYSPSNTKIKALGIHLTASVVKSLSSLVFYFRHIAEKGDFIIIDEPELNLHPDNQRKLAKLLVRIVNCGFKVMISTHSDYIIREINNLIMLNSGTEKAKKLMRKHKYVQEELLDYKKLAAYIFNNKKSTSLDVTEIGFEVDTIDEEISALNKASEEIYLTLF